jgi:hypothetical protein
VQPGSSSSSGSAAKKLTSPGPLAAALAGQKQAGSTRRLFTDAFIVLSCLHVHLAAYMQEQAFEGASCVVLVGLQLSETHTMRLKAVFAGWSQTT